MIREIEGSALLLYHVHRAGLMMNVMLGDLEEGCPAVLLYVSRSMP